MSTVDKPERQRRRGGRVLLITSLAVNLFLVGLMAGGWASGFRFRGPIASNFMRQAVMPDMHVRQLARQLPDGARMKLREAMTDTRAVNRTIIHDIRLSRRAIFQSLRADPFDLARFEEALQSARQAELARRKLSHQVLLKFLDSLDDQEKEFVLKMVSNAFERPQESFRPERLQNRDNMRQPGMRLDFVPKNKSPELDDVE